MYQLHAKEELNRAHEIFEEIFHSKDPFSIPFVQQKKFSYMVVFPTLGYHLTQEQYDAFTQAAKAMKEHYFFIAETEWEPFLLDKVPHWHCDFPAYENYANIPIPIENAIYSPTAQWGILLSHEDHAIIGGPSDFIEKLKSSYPDWKTDLEELRQYWKDNPNEGWLKAVINELHF